jgi:hypothetical protein
MLTSVRQIRTQPGDESNRCDARSGGGNHYWTTDPSSSGGALWTTRGSYDGSTHGASFVARQMILFVPLGNFTHQSAPISHR